METLSRHEINALLRALSKELEQEQKDVEEIIGEDVIAVRVGVM